MTATATDHANLFWACRGGGGGNFGIETRFVFSTHRTADFTRWQLRWPWATAADVLQGWTSWVYAGGSDLIREPFTPAGATAVVDVINDRQRRKLATGTVLIDSLGGAIDDVPRGARLPAIPGQLGRGSPRSTVARNLDWFATAQATVAPHSSGEAYQNYLDAGRNDWRQTYYGANYSRLQTVKATYDKGRLFTFPQAIGA